MEKQKPLTDEELLMLAVIIWFVWPEIKRVGRWLAKTIPKVAYKIGWLYGYYVQAITHRGYGKYLK